MGQQQRDSLIEGRGFASNISLVPCMLLVIKELSFAANVIMSKKASLCNPEQINKVKCKNLQSQERQFMSVCTITTCQGFPDRQQPEQ